MLPTAIGDYIFYTHAPVGEITFISPSVEQVLGFRPEEMLGHNWREWVGEQNRGRQTAEQVQQAVEAGTAFFKFDLEVTHADGSTRLLEVQEHALFDEAGNYRAMEGIAKDITTETRTAEELQRLKKDLEQRVAERTAELIRINEKLKESESRYRNVVEDQTEFIARWLPGGKYTFVNEAYCRYVHKSRNELVGSTFIPTIHEDDRARVEREIASLTPERPSITSEHRVYRPDGSIGWNHWTNRALFDDQGNLEEYQSVGRDITDLKEAADTIREREAYLAHVSRLATMGELVAGIAHEVHQPLHAAKTFAEAARRSLDSGTAEGSARAKDCMQEISEAVSRTAKIIRHLRTFTKPKPIQFESLDLNDIVQEAAEIISFETGRAGARLHWDLSVDLPTVRGDQVQLVQVCINMLINAYDAMNEVPEQRRNLVISTKSDKQNIELSFCDAGCGISDEQKQRLFDAFYTTKPHGMGMGLSLCQTIAEAHGGKISAFSNTGPGATFVVSLPIPKRNNS